MPLYSFQDPEGNVVEEFLPMSKAPRIGSVITRAGVRLRRIPEQAQQQAAKRNVHFGSVQLEPWAEGAPRYAADGTPQFDSLREVEDFCSKRTDAGVEISYGDV